MNRQMPSGPGWTPPDEQDAVRVDPMSDRILDAALEQFVLLGITASSVDAIARRARASRATVFRKFESKDGLVSALMGREFRRVFEQAQADVAGFSRAEDRVVEGFISCLCSARSHPLLTSLLRTEPELVLPLLTTDGQAALALGRAILSMALRDVAELDEPDAIAEMLTRMGISLLLTPESVVALESDDELRRFANRFLVPLAIADPARTAQPGARE